MRVSERKTSFWERLMFRKLDLWFVCLLAILGVIGTIAFGNIAIYTFTGGTKAGFIGDAVLTLSTIPQQVGKLFNADEYSRAKSDRHPGKSGFAFAYAKGARPEAGYLLLSRYDGDDLRSYVEFWDLNAQTMLHRWAPPIDEINASSTLVTKHFDLARDRNVNRYIIRHPAITQNGDILIQSHTPLTRVDMCNRVVWNNDTRTFHHSVEADREGYFWTAGRIEPASIPGVWSDSFMDDAVVRISPEGKVVFEKSVAQLLIDNGMKRYVYGRSGYDYDSVHLNDVQPVEETGKYWQKGDVFLSLRSPSMLVLYRPETNKVIWFRQGPWLHQHDVDILDDHRISTFNNNSYEMVPNQEVEGHSGIMVFNFDTGEVTQPWDALLMEQRLRSETEGLHRVRKNGNLFVEEQNYGRIFELAYSGELLWDYVNRAKRGDLYRVGWSTFLEPEEGAGIAAVLAARKCS